MARVKGANKMGFAEGYKTYNPAKTGYGTPALWRALFNVRMSADVAYSVRQESKYATEYDALSEIAGIHVDETSMWSEIKKAFRKASMNCHPDRIKTHGKGEAQAEAEFKEVSAAMVMLEDVYRKQGRYTD
jgi:DnaJ domain